jgi:hypothetical protein
VKESIELSEPVWCGIRVGRKEYLGGMRGAGVEEEAGEIGGVGGAAGRSLRSSGGVI